MSPAVVNDAAAIAPLPDSKSPSLALVHPTPEEKLGVLKQNVQAWRGPLSEEAYLRREETLFNQPLTRDGGITHWVLVDTAEPPESRRVLASCESIRKRAFLAVTAEDGGAQVDQVLSHGIGSVFCEPSLRGRGYAARMMREMGKILRTWQVESNVEGRQRCLFSVLYSDIGKKFYASHGWHPFPSSHVFLPPVLESQSIKNSELPPSQELRAEDLAALCRVDEELLRRGLETHQSGRKFRVALIPDAATISWHHAREDFVTENLLGRSPVIKGAIVGDRVGSRAWCVWCRVWSDGPDSPDPDNKLYILRLVVEGENDASRTEQNGTASANGDRRDEKHQREMITSLLLAAQVEAGKWGLKEVHVWNPTQEVLPAAQRARDLALPFAESTAIKVVDRDSDSITSLMWYGHDEAGLGRDSGGEVEWVGNERYGWC